MTTNKTVTAGGLEGEDIWGDDAKDPNDEFNDMKKEDIIAMIREIDAQMSKNRKEMTTISTRIQGYEGPTNLNEERVKRSCQMPYLVANIGEILEVEEEEEKREGSGITSHAKAIKKDAKKEEEKKMKKAVVLKTTNRATVYLPGFGMIDPEGLKPGDIVGVNKETYNLIDRLPPDYDSRVKAMEVDEKPVEEYSDIGGLDKQIEELVEAIVLPMQHKERFQKLGIRPPKGLLMHGPPGTGKTLMARACAAQTQATFLKLAGTNLVQMYIGDGAKMVRDAFELAKEKSPCIIFIDELDAVGTKRDSSGENSSREVHRTMLELLNQLDGFSQNDDIKVIAATNRPDVLDPALLRSGRLDRKIELPLPNEESRARIMQIHSRKMTVDKNDVNFEELARSTPEFNGAQLKAVCVEAGMEALRRNGNILRHEDFIAGINEVQAKKKSSLNYYA